MRKKLSLITLVLLSAVLLSACGGSIRGTTWAGLTADENTAYLADVSLVYGIDLKDGREIWRFSDREDNKAQFYAKPVITPDSLVIVGSAGGKHILYALNPQDLLTEGDIKSPAVEWTFTGAGNSWVASPLIVGNMLFAPNSDGNLYVIDLNDGQSQKQPVEVIELGGRLWAQPVTDGERVYVTSLDHSIYAVDVETYALAWHEDISAAIPGSPAIGPDGKLYVGSLASKLEQFDPATGQHISVLDAEYWIWSTPVMDGDALYFGDLKGNFYSFNTSTSTLNWSFKPDGAITASPLVLENLILVAAETGKTKDDPGTVFAISHEGEILWFEEVGGKIYTTPVVAGDLILVAPLETDFYLAALDLNGRQVWTFAPEK